MRRLSLSAQRASKAADELAAFNAMHFEGLSRLNWLAQRAAEHRIADDDGDDCPDEGTFEDALIGAIDATRTRI